MDSFRLLGEYQVVELPNKLEPVDYGSLIQDRINNGVTVFILMQNQSLGPALLSGQKEHNDIKGLPQPYPKVSFFITIQYEKGYVLIESEKSKL